MTARIAYLHCEDGAESGRSLDNALISLRSVGQRVGLDYRFNFSFGYVIQGFVKVMKVWTNGRYLSARFVTSTLCGQMVNTAVFYIFGLWGMIQSRILTKSILVASLAKVSVELLLLPVTLKVSLWLKRAGNVDYFDETTNFNPLKF